MQVHGFLTVNGEKMSKRKGTFVLASTYLEHLDPAYLRYFYATKLEPRSDDLDLNLEEFVAKVNSDLVGKVVNLASRTARFVKDSGLSASYPEDGGLFAAAAKQGEEIAAAYEACDFAQAMRSIMALADRANEYVDRTEPWKLKKDPAKRQELHGRMQRGAQPVSAARGLPGAGPAQAGRGQRHAPRCPHCRLERRTDAARRNAGRASSST